VNGIGNLFAKADSPIRGCTLIKINHDFNDPRRVDDEGRLILQERSNKSEWNELVEGMHVIIDGDTFEYEAVLELVEQFTSDGLVDTWRARVVPGSYRYSDPEADAKRSEWLWDMIRIGDSYAVRPLRSEDKGRWDMAKEGIRNRWDTYLFLRKKWNLRPDKIEDMFNQADLAWYEEHKRRRGLLGKHGATT
jgi:hypothetical protein